MTHVNHKRRKNSLGLLALEPRWMFDGAAAFDAAHAAPDASAKALILDAPTPVQVRAADPTQNSGKKEVVFVDTSVSGYQALEAAVKPGIEIEEIDGTKSGLAQMAKWAETHTGYDSISILSHGNEASVQLGTDTLRSASLSDAVTQAELAEIGHALNSGGNLLLYGCDVARGTDGQQFIEGLAAATGADVAASTNVTGIDGDWTLEKTSGAAVTADQLDPTALAALGLDLTAPAAFQIVVDGTTSSADVYLYDSTTDAQHNIYVTGSFYRTVVFTIGGQATTFTEENRPRGFAAKFDASGACLWAKVIGASADASTYVSSSAIAVDSGGNIIIGGSYKGTADFDPGAAVQSQTSAGGYDIFIEKLDSSGNFVWVKSYGSSDTTADDNLLGLAVAGTQIAFGGSFGKNSTNSIDFGGTTLNANDTAGYVVSLDSTGATQWAYKYDDSSTYAAEPVYSVKSDGSNFYVVGKIATAETINSAPGGAGNLSVNYSLFLQKLSVAGTSQWFETMASASTIDVNHLNGTMAVDGNGDVILSGYYSGTVNFDPTGTHNLTSGGIGTNVFVAKYSGANGGYAWADSIGGTGNMGAYGGAVTTDGNNNVYVGGMTKSSAINIDPAGGQAGSVTGLSAYSFFVDKLSSSGAFAWGKTGTSSGKIYITGVISANGITDLVGYTKGSITSISDSGSPISNIAYDAGFVEGFGTDGTPFGGTSPPPATAPTFTSATTANFAENGTGTVYAAAATASAGSVSYALSGNDAGKFNLNTSTGVLTFKNTPDFETPASTANSNVYSVTITATDSNGNTAQGVTVTVTNVAPAWTAPAPITLSDSSANGTAVVTVTGTGDTSGASWSVQGGNADGLFTINATTGAITIADASKFNFATTPSYTLTVRESDGTTNADHDITVNVSHAGPSFTSDAAVNFAENGSGTVYTAAATTTGGTVSYALAGADAGKFNINSTTGAITFKVAPDKENPASAASSNVYSITINATDNNGTSSKAVAITVTDVAPAWTAPAPISLNDNSTNGTVVATLAGTGDTSGVNWSIQGGNASGLFAINAATGAITIADASKFNFATTPSYTFAVREADGTTNADHNVTVNVNHIIPTIAAPPPPSPTPAPPAPPPVVVAPPPAPPQVVEPPRTIVRDAAPPPAFTSLPQISEAPKAPVAEAPKAPVPVAPVVVAPPVTSVVMTQQFTPTSADGSFRVPVVTATQGGPAVEGLVALRPEMQTPTLTDGPVRIALPLDAFAHTRSDAVVTLNAVRINGQPLPQWLNFDSRSGTLTGQPPGDFKGTMVVKVIARDERGQEATITIRINGQPEKTGAIETGRPVKLGQHQRDNTVGKVAFTQQLKMAARNAAIRFS